MNEGGGAEAAQVAGQAAVVSGAALAGAADASGQAGQAQATADAAALQAQQAADDAEEARVSALSAEDALAELRREQLRDYRTEKRNREMAAAPPVVAEAPAAGGEGDGKPAGDTLPKSVEKQTKKRKSLRERWEDATG